MANDPEVPEGTAVLPPVPPELGVHPLLLATLHAVVFFDGSSADVVNDAAADEALNYLASYLQQLQGSDLQRVREDLEVLTAYARDQDWPREGVLFLETFLADYGVGENV